MIELKRASVEDAKCIWEMQLLAFQELLNKYQDYETSPGSESLEKVCSRLKQPYTFFYLIQENGIIVGAIRVVDTKEAEKRKRIAPIFVLPKYQNKGIAQKAMQLVEEIHGNSFWALDTILQEQENCYLYEKMGYHKTGKFETINDKMTMTYYHKD